MRRIVDILAALFFLRMTWPLMLVIGLFIKRGSPGPVFYTPVMLGQFGRPFRFYRFRTMRMDDTGQLTAQERLTPIGRFIRNYSLDHLPSLINLLNGTMTIVGPRPMEAEQVSWRDPIWQDYFQRKPGIFNYAILKMGQTWTPGRKSNPTKNQELEIEYQRNRSTYADLRLVIDFFRKLVTSKGNIKARGKADPKIWDSEKDNHGKEI